MADFEDAQNKVTVDSKDKNYVYIDETITHVEVAVGGPQGPPGPGASKQEIIAKVAYAHTQIAASYTWTIVHNLGFIPSVAVFDSADTMVEGEVSHNDTDSLSITFLARISGKAYLS